MEKFRRTARRSGTTTVASFAAPLVAATAFAISTAPAAITVRDAPAMAESASTEPALAMTGSTTSDVVPQPSGQPSVFVNRGGALWNYWYYAQTLNSAVVVPSGVVSNPVAVLQPDGSPSVFYEGPGGSLWNVWYVNGNWDSAEIAGSGVASGPAAILQSNGEPTVFVQGPGNSLLNFWYIPSQGIWGAGTAAPTGSAFSAPSVIAQVDAGDAPSVFVQGPGNSLLNFWYIPAQGAWGAGTVAQGGSTTSAPAVVPQENAGDIPSVFVQGPGNSLLNYWYIPSQGIWGAGTVESDGADASAPSAIDEGGGPPTVFFQAPDGSVLNYSYDNGNWMKGPPPDSPVFVPSGTPYFTSTATMTENGSGTGYSAYVVAHDNDLNAVAVGIQSDTTAPQSNGHPYFIWELVQDGVFTYQYLGPASNDPTPVTLAWWPDVETAVFYEGNTPIADVAATLVPQLLFSIRRRQAGR